MIKKFRILFVCFVCLISFVGCGSSGSDSPRVPVDVPTPIRIVEESQTRVGNGLLFVVGEHEPYTGKVVSYDTNGKLEQEKFYKTGRLEKMIGYRENGTKTAEMEFKNGLPNGEAIQYYENGKIKAKIFYTNGGFMLIS